MGLDFFSPRIWDNANTVQNELHPTEMGQGHVLYLGVMLFLKKAI